MTQATYVEQYLSSLGRFGMKPGLERIQRLLQAMGDPHKHFRIIHIAGSNGKGSTASFIAAALSGSGHRTGLYTSPHLERYNERIQIDGQPISDASLHELVDAVRPYVEQVETELGSPTEFEVGTALAFEHFRRQGVDLAVVETGLGGRLDSTNVVDPLLSVITPITFDHAEILGPTIRDIAGEKAGIIKPGRPVVIAPQLPDALNVLIGRAQEVGAPLTLVQPHGNDDLVERTHRFSPLGWGRDGGEVVVTGPDGDRTTYRVGMLGSHQLLNAAVAVGAIRELARLGLDIQEGALGSAIADTRVAGRLEMVSTDPLILLDGAHNELGARQLSEAIKHLFPSRPLTLVCGISKDKPAAAILSLLGPLATEVVTTEPSSSRLGCWRAHELADCLANLRLPRATVIPKVKQALEYARANATRESLICVTGSLYLIGEARALLVGSGPK